MKIVILRFEKRGPTYSRIMRRATPLSFDLLHTPKNGSAKSMNTVCTVIANNFFSGLNYCQFQILLFVIVIHFLQRNYFIILLKDTWSFISLKITLSMNFIITIINDYLMISKEFQFTHSEVWRRFLVAGVWISQWITVKWKLWKNGISNLKS